MIVYLGVDANIWSTVNIIFDNIQQISYIKKRYERKEDFEKQRYIIENFCYRSFSFD
jgi:hypothetical protein